MTETIQILDQLDEIVRPELPNQREQGIALVGAGAIAAAAHLPAYRLAGFNVRGIYDKDVERARSLASRFGVSRTYTDAEEIAGDSSVSIVDIAVDPLSQAEIAMSMAAAGKHLLCQKPLSEELNGASELVGVAEQNGVLLAVNEQMRWDQLIRASHALIQEGLLGSVVDVLFDLDIFTDWQMWPWMAARPRLELFYHSVHHLDSLRYLLGEPTKVWCSQSRYPGQTAVGETRSTVALEYAGDVRAMLHVNHNNWSTDPRAIVRIRGTEGNIDGTLGLLYDYPTGRPDTLRFTKRGGSSQEHAFVESWLPHAFIGPMASLMVAAERGGQPLTNGRDNLRTLVLLHAAYRSAAEGRALDPAEFSEFE